VTRDRRPLLILAIAASAVVSAIYLGLGLDGLAVGLGRLGHARDFFAAAASPAVVSEADSAQSLLPILLDAVSQTLKFALAAMSLALVLSVPLTLMCSERFWSGPGFVAARACVAAMRSVHELIWAIILLAAVGLTPASAVIAIAVPSAGILAKVFAELIDEAPDDAGQALHALGASRLQVLLLGVVPGALASMVAYGFYRFECALRSAAVLGFFGFPTLGYRIHKSAENLYFEEVWTYLYALIFLMAVAELWSAVVRRRLEVV
jgi:phosphonate transport system permease protein